MTNPKTRKTGTAQSPSTDQRHQQLHHRNAMSGWMVDDVPEEADEEEEDEEEANCSWEQHVLEDLHTPNVSDVEDDDENNDEEDRGSSSSFSLQECFNEFRARRIRRISTQSREAASGDGINISNDPADADLINQNRSNKEHERKCKPCQNGFCYCFTSDSGEGGGGSRGCGAAAPARAAHVRQSRRSRRSESSQFSLIAPQQRHASKSKERRRQSAPATFKAPHQKQQQQTPNQTRGGKVASSSSPLPKHSKAATTAQHLTAISRLETTSKDAPLIHIIQELRNNCVISEVRVNKHKMQAAAAQAHQRSRSCNATRSSSSSSPKKMPSQPSQYSKLHTKPPSMLPSAPPALDKISEIESQLSTETSPFVCSSGALDTSSKSNDSAQKRRRHKAAGRLLQKRLSQSQIQFKPRNLDQPPPKPPRSSLAFEDARKSSVSTLASTSPSVREAEHVLDEFLRKRGVKVPGDEVAAQESRKNKKSPPPLRAHKQEPFLRTQEVLRHSAIVGAARPEKRKSYPLTQKEQKTNFRKTPLPTCPSLSDIERFVVATAKKSSNYEKNIRQAVSGEKPVKELSFGWNEPKIAEMLNCDTNATRDEFQTKAACAQPQSGAGHAPKSLGWQIPPKIDLDTVDGNLASNIESKSTPVKTRPYAGGGSRDSQKFIWGEQWRNLSPWSNKHAGAGGAGVTRQKQKSNLKSASSSFLNNSKKKILRLVSPKKDNKEARPFQAPRKTPLRTVGVQTSRVDFQRSYENSSSTVTPQSPPGSYHSVEPRPMDSQQSTTTISGTSSVLPPPSPPQQFSVDAETQFDFSRIVQSPPKKATSRAGISQRKLNFPLNCSAGGASCLNDAGDRDGVSNASSAPNMTKTYRSFHSDLDQDVTLSKMGYILGNIRAKLEASDEHAIRTFQEIERREQQSASFDIPDSHNLREQTRVDIHQYAATAPRRRPRHSAREEELLHDPIYSEIEEDSIHFSCSPQFDNKTGSGRGGIQHFAAVRNPEALYAKVNKAPKQQQKLPAPPPTALGKLLHDSMRQLQSRSPTTPLPPVPEPESGSDTVSYSSPPHVTRLPHCASLNNIRVMEHQSPPKLNRNLNKSDLSLHRSEIFLDNLCSSEIILEASGLERQEKVDNHKLNRSYTSLRNHAEMHLSESTSPTQVDGNENYDDSISYELPHDDDGSSIAAGGSTLGLSIIAPPQSHNQSTPKKPTPSQTFMTKGSRNERSHPPSPHQSLNIDMYSAGCAQTPPFPHNQSSSSCPTTPHQLPPAISVGRTAKAKKKTHAASLDDVRSASVLNNNNKSNDDNNNGTNNPLSVSTLARYKRLKSALRKSFRKSKNFVKSETKRLSTSLSFPLTTHTAVASNQNELPANHRDSIASSSTCNLDALFALDETAPVAEQLAKAVSICRQLPDLEISPEMVEAERLLLFSSLKRSASGAARNTFFSGGCRLEQRQRQQCRRFFIDAMRLPVRPAASQDLFFNYFYIGAFECGGVIRSTQSVECRNNEAIFHDCGIEFACGAPEEVTFLAGRDVPEVRCEIFMLRLRKVSTLSLEPRKSNAKVPQLLTPSPTTSCSSSASRDAIVSRFRLHASFTVKARDFAPFEYVAGESKNNDQLCLRAAGSCSIPLTLRTRSTNLASEILLSGRAEARFAKHTHSGFLNVQEPHSQHNWNRRWCTLDGLQLRIWQDANGLQEQPLLNLELRDNVQAAPPPLIAAPRELCARPRSFCLQYTVTKTADVEGVAPATAAVFFAAETEVDLAVWLQQLNAVLDFVVAWLQ